MFKCQATGKISKPNEKPVRLVIERREVTYYKKVRNKETGELVLAIDSKTGNPQIEGYGWEIVEEINILPSVYEKLKEQNGTN